MTARITDHANHRVPLSRERVLDTALRLADQGGIDRLSMRNLAGELGVGAMALYYHFANKDEVLDGIVDLVYREVGLPPSGPDWKSAMRERAISMREVLSRHRWAIGMMEARRRPGPANLRHHDAVLGSLRSAGFDIALAAHVYSLLDSYIYGFALTKMSLPFETPDEAAAVAHGMLQPFPVNEYPSLFEMIEHALKPGYDYEDEFEYGLDVILDGLDGIDGVRSLA
jgi:AcrR family transcriptional regulator